MENNGEIIATSSNRRITSSIPNDDMRYWFVANCKWTLRKIMVSKTADDRSSYAKLAMKLHVIDGLLAVSIREMPTAPPIMKSLKCFWM